MMRMRLPQPGSPQACVRASRSGPELLTGLLRCGHCDNRIQVRDSGKEIVYRCLGLKDRERANCISFGAVRVDAEVGESLMRALEPVGIEAALAALTARDRNDEAAALVLTETEIKMLDRLIPDPEAGSSTPKTLSSCLTKIAISRALRGRDPYWLPFGFTRP